MKPSEAAQFGAAHWAYHARCVRPAVLAETVASWLLGPPLSTILRVAPLRWLFWRPLLAKVQPISVFVVRNRLAEDDLGDSIGQGCRQ